MPKVLVVDDEALIREDAVQEFTQAGFAATHAKDADEALAIMSADRDWNLLFTDIRMPGEIDGWHLARIAMLLIPGIRIIYTSGYAKPNSGLTNRERFIEKPYLFSDVKNALRSLGV